MFVFEIVKTSIYTFTDGNHLKAEISNSINAFSVRVFTYLSSLVPIPTVSSPI